MSLCKLKIRVSIDWADVEIKLIELDQEMLQDHLLVGFVGSVSRAHETMLNSKVPTEDPVVV